MLNHIENILNRLIGGFRQYVLTAPVHMSFVSQNLCDMLGVQESELLHDSEDLYAGFVHPEDRENYLSFFSALLPDSQPRILEYRLIRKDGTVLWVKDSIYAERNKEGILLAYSVITDISDLKKENKSLRFLNDTIPCGFIKYTCDKQPQVTYVNQTMLEMLRFSDEKVDELDYLELCKSNIFLLIPAEERRRFSLYLKKVYSSDAPVAGEMTVLRCDGTRVRVFGWVAKHKNEDGSEEFQSVCMDITERHRARISRDNQRYLNALTDVYDKIFELNLDADTLTCLHCEEQSSFHGLLHIAMRIDSASEKWIMDAVVPEDQELVRSFFHDFCQKKLHGPDAKPPQITYRATATDGVCRRYVGNFIKIDEAIEFYCCRRASDTEEKTALRMENDQLKENMKALVTRFMDGFAAFELSAEGLTKPLYSSKNVCDFFGYTESEWLELMEKFTPIDNFIANCEAGKENFETLLRTGEAEFLYFDHKSGTSQRIKAICSQKAADNLSPRYVMLYTMEKTNAVPMSRMPASQPVTIRTFGYFDVFVGEQPIAFRNKKAKELLALLVDRRGGYITSEEAICFLWENEPASPATLAKYRKTALRLKNTLEEYGAADILESVDGKRRIIPEKVTCDLYQYLTGKNEYAQLFKGSYLTNYSWSETTLGELTGYLE